MSVAELVAVSVHLLLTSVFPHLRPRGSTDFGYGRQRFGCIRGQRGNQPRHRRVRHDRPGWVRNSDTSAAQSPPSAGATIGQGLVFRPDGWGTIGNLDLRGVEEIGWMADLDAGLLEAWADLDHFADQLAVLKRCLLISIDDGGSGGNWLLHADSTRADGEWTAYEWWPGEGGELEESADFAALVSLAVERFH